MIDRTNKKLATIYIPKSKDDELRQLAADLSSPECHVGVGELIAAIIGHRMGNLEGIDNPILKTYFTLIS